jgi:hypothetical protein
MYVLVYTHTDRGTVYTALLGPKGTY